MNSALRPRIMASISMSDAEVVQRMLRLEKGCSPSCSVASTDASNLPSAAKNVAAMATAGLAAPKPRSQSFRAPLPFTVPATTASMTLATLRAPSGTPGDVATA